MIEVSLLFISIILTGQPDKKPKYSLFSDLHQFEAIQIKMLCKHSNVIYMKSIILYITLAFNVLNISI